MTNDVLVGGDVIIGEVVLCGLPLCEGVICGVMISGMTRCGVRVDSNVRQVLHRPPRSRGFVEVVLTILGAPDDELVETSSVLRAVDLDTCVVEFTLELVDFGWP